MSKDKDGFLPPVKRKDMLEQAEKCEEFKQIAKGLWPDEFGEEWEDITEETETEIEYEGEVGYFQISHHGDIIVTTGRLPDGYKKVGDIPIHINVTSKDTYKIKLNANGDFRILKRKEA